MNPNGTIFYFMDFSHVRTARGANLHARRGRAAPRRGTHSASWLGVFFLVADWDGRLALKRIFCD
jgi:hypothetical protein